MKKKKDNITRVITTDQLERAGLTERSKGRDLTRSALETYDESAKRSLPTQEMPFGNPETTHTLEQDNNKPWIDKVLSAQGNRITRAHEAQVALNRPKATLVLPKIPEPKPFRIGEKEITFTNNKSWER